MTLITLDLDFQLAVLCAQRLQLIEHILHLGVAHWMEMV